MINRVLLQFGSSPNAQPLSFEPGSMTVFVGPNNAGKSLVLRELGARLSISSGNSINPPRIVLSIVEDPLLREDIEQILSTLTQIDPIRWQLDIRDPVSDQHLNGTVISSVELESGFNQDRHYQGPYKEMLLRSLVIKLDGQTRLNLTNPRPTGDLLGSPTNILASLFKNHQARRRIQNITADVFGSYLIIDPSAMNYFGLKFSERPPQDLYEEQGLGPQSLEFYRQAQPIEEFSDGVRAFIGILVAIFATNYRMILIDEPEAFLYPPLARKLGKILTSLASERRGNVFAATHSANFLMGCIQAGKPVNVVRLTYLKNEPRARRLSSTDIYGLMRDPLLRSTGVLDALFYQGTVVCEGDTDRALYEEINERLVAAGRGLSDILFINAINKQTVHKIIAPLRRMGIPAVAVVDLDIFKEGDLSTLLRAASMPEPLVQASLQIRNIVRDTFESAGQDMKVVGVAGLPDAAIRASAYKLIADAAEYGVFIVPVGELERWMLSLNVEVTKTKWLTSLFERMGMDPADANYVYPQEGDIWQFVSQIVAWINNPLREGIPD